MKALNILFAGNEQMGRGFSLRMKAIGIDVELLGVLDSYSPTPPADLEFIETVTDVVEVDYVIIANNMGAGVEKARVLAESLRAKTLITWTLGERGKIEAPYREMGFTHFCKRADLSDTFISTFNLSQTSSA